jgi:transketolase
VALISTGAVTNRALAAADLLAGCGITAGVLHCHTVKPLDEVAVAAAVAGVRLAVTIEEHTRIGGLGSAVADVLVETDSHPPLLRLALPDAFPEGYGSQDHLLGLAGLQPSQIAERIMARLQETAR